MLECSSGDVLRFSKERKLKLVSTYAEKRQAEAQRIRDKYPDRIPVSYWWPNSFIRRTTVADRRNDAGDCGEG